MVSAVVSTCNWQQMQAHICKVAKGNQKLHPRIFQYGWLFKLDCGNRETVWTFSVFSTLKTVFMSVQTQSDICTVECVSLVAWGNNIASNMDVAAMNLHILL